jgi:hypothetical protein
MTPATHSDDAHEPRSGEARTIAERLTATMTETGKNNAKNGGSLSGPTKGPFPGRLRGRLFHRKTFTLYERTVHRQVQTRLERTGLSRERSYDRAAAYIRARRMVQLADAMPAETLLKHARALELADRTIEAIEREAGMDKRTTGSGLRPSRSKVKAPTVDDESRACDAAALDDASAEEAETAPDNAARDGLHPPAM